MDKGNFIKEVELLEIAELQFKFALAISATETSDKLSLSYLDVFSFGKHVIGKNELILNKKQEKLASVALEHSTTYLMITQADTVLNEAYGQSRFEKAESDIVNASCITRLIRNAFAHSPLNPIWKIDRKFQNRIYSINGIISLETQALNGKQVKRSDYGGPLALLRLVQFIRKVRKSS